MIQAEPEKIVAEPYDCFDYCVYVEYCILVDVLYNCLNYSLAEPWLMSVLYVQIKVRRKWTSHESRARSGSGTIHTWPRVWLRAFDIFCLALEGNL